MSRYIDADELKYYGNHIGDEYEDKFHDAQWVYRNQIDEAPHIDLVRCKECRYWIGETEYYEDREYKACWQLCGQFMNSEFWCKYGEREGE